MERSFAERMKLAFRGEFRTLYIEDDTIKERPLHEMLAEAARVRDELVWAYRYVFPTDPVSGAIPPEQAEELCRKALECGRECAEEVRSRYPQLSMRAICEKCGVRVTWDLEDAGGSVVRFAEYEKPDHIRLNRECIRRTGRLLGEAEALPEMAGVSVEEVLLAHELYHYMEHIHPQLFTCSYRHRQGRAALFGPARLVSLSEIAAGAFIAGSLGFDYSCYLYDLAFTYSFSPKEAARLFARMPVQREGGV